MKIGVIKILLLFWISGAQERAESDIKELKLDVWAKVQKSDGSLEIWLRDGVVTYHANGCTTFERENESSLEWDVLASKYKASNKIGKFTVCDE